MATIDVLIAVDGAKLAEQVSDGSISAGTQDNPTSLGSYSSSDVYIAMISESSNVTNEQGKSELTIVANSGDSVRWTITTFGNNIDNTAYLYNGHFNPSSAISNLVYLPITNTTYLPSTQDPTSAPSKFNNHLYVALGTVLTPGQKIQYTLSFKLVNNANGDVIGYFYWDPFIQVNG